MSPPGRWPVPTPDRECLAPSSRFTEAPDHPTDTSGNSLRCIGRLIRRWRIRPTPVGRTADITEFASDWAAPLDDAVGRIIVSSDQAQSVAHRVEQAYYWLMEEAATGEGIESMLHTADHVLGAVGETLWQVPSDRLATVAGLLGQLAARAEAALVAVTAEAETRGVIALS